MFLILSTALALGCDAPKRSDRNRSFTEHLIADNYFYAYGIAAADLDGDGDIDITSADARGYAMYWYENDGHPGDGSRWTKHVIGSLPFAFEVVAADIDGDGLLDAIATAFSGRLVWFRNAGVTGAPWEAQVLKDNWSGANQVIVADLNGAGSRDIIACAEGRSRDLRWWENHLRTGSAAGPKRPQVQ